MKPLSCPKSSSRRLRVVFAAAACTALVACATTGPSAAAGAEPRTAAAPGSTAAQPVDEAKRNRQYIKAEALYRSGRLKEAAGAFEELTRTYPTDARSWLKYGNTLTKLSSYDEAANAYQRATALDASQGSAPLNLALVRLFQAQQSLDVATARLAADSPEHAQADALQRQIRALLGDSDSAATTH
jgi:tetratricopeptide (TPR) repeat protein